MQTTTASLIASLFACVALAAQAPEQQHVMEDQQPPLGAFSVSLAVKDLAASRAFYEKLGFVNVLGEQEQNWLIMRSGKTTIGLFQGMFPSNIMTFNPGWDHEAKPLTSFDDVRAIQSRLKAAGVQLTTEADEESTGPAHFTLVDPDGNMLLFDQHVPKPRALPNVKDDGQDQ